MICLNLNQIGLILNIAGTIGLFFFGLPSRIQDLSDPVGDADKTGKEADCIKKSNKIIKLFSALSLLVIFLGFICQLIAST